uniref:YIP1 family protein n=1 Tax=Thermodesulfobacterium geofontis TaxID=1295609 RepID=A0A7C4NVH3_9BACT
MNIVESAKNIILKPSETWTEIKAEEVSISDLYKSYVVILAAIPAIAQFIGSGIIGYSFLGEHFKMGITGALASAIVSYVLSLIAIYVEALIADALAPSFGSQKNITNAFKAVAYSMTPAWVAGVFYILPNLWPLVLIASLYGIYLLYLGLPLMMDTPKEKALGYVIVVVVVTFIINFAIGAIVGAIFTPMPMGGSIGGMIE